MAENEFQFHGPAISDYAARIVNSSTIVEETEEGIKVCPLCGSLVRKFFIDFSTRVKMCTNLECEYPFGENFTIYTTEDGVELTRKPRRSNKSTTSVGKSSRCTSTLGTNSNLSASEWGDLRSSQAYDSDDNLSVTSTKIFTKKSSLRQIEKRAKRQEDEKHIKQNVEKIRECNKVLFDGREEFGTILNEKWIKNLSTMQSASGMKLVKDRELKKLKKTQDICHGDVKIDIESKKDAMSSIVIEIGSVAKADNKQVKKT